MPHEYLQEISKLELPYTETKQANIDKLRILRAAGMVQAMLPRVHAETPWARVLVITEKGRAALQSAQSAPGEFLAACTAKKEPPPITAQGPLLDGDAG